MMNKKSYWINAGKLTMLQRVGMLFFGMLNFLLLVRMMDMKSYGVWMLFMSVTSLIRTAREGFLKKPLIRFMNKLEKEEKSVLQGTSLILNLLFSLVSSVVLVVISGYLADLWDAQGLVGLFMIFFFTNFIMAYFSHYNNVLEASFRFNGPMVANLLKSGILFTAIIFYFITGMEIDLMMLGYFDLISTLIATITMLLYARSLIKYKFIWDTKKSLELFSYGKYTLGTNISGMILRNTDIWMIGIFMSPAAVAVYNVAIRITNLFEVPTMAMASIIFPEAVNKSKVNGKKAFKDLFEKSVTVIFLLILPMVVGGLLFADTIIWLLAGEDYGEAAGILRVTMLYGLIVPFNKQMGILLDATGRAKLNMLFGMRNAVINVILNYLMIPIFGTIGAAYATLSTMLIVLLINQIFLYRKYDVDPRSLVKYSRYYLIRLKNFVLSKF